MEGGTRVVLNIDHGVAAFIAGSHLNSGGVCYDVYCHDHSFSLVSFEDTNRRRQQRPSYP